jgi:hypothetical protein
MAEEQQQRDGQPENLEDILEGLEQKIDRLKVLYDQYFMGIEKVEPLVVRKNVNRTILNLAKIQIRNTGLRFRYRTLVQRFNTYLTYWNRILREIELGTYKRDVLRASKAMAAKGAELPQEIAAALKPRDRERLRAAGNADLPLPPAENADDQDLPMATPMLELEAELPPEPPRTAAPPAGGGAARPPTPPLGAAAARPPTPPLGAAAARPPTPPLGTTAARPPTPPLGASAARPPTPPLGATAARPPTPAHSAAAVAASAPKAAPAAGGMTRDQVEVLYRRLIQAKKLCGEPTGGLSVESLASTIDKIAPKVMKEKGCREVEFTVVIKNEKVILKAGPKRQGGS